MQKMGQAIIFIKYNHVGVLNERSSTLRSQFQLLTLVDKCEVEKKVSYLKDPFSEPAQLKNLKKFMVTNVHSPYASKYYPSQYLLKQLFIAYFYILYI